MKNGVAGDRERDRGDHCGVEKRKVRKYQAELRDLEENNINSSIGR